jgi:hypothetical protein
MTTTGGTAGAVREEAAREAATVKDRALEETGAVVGEAKRQAGHVADEARQELRRQGDEQAHRLAGGLHDTGRQLHAMADAGDGLVADLARQASDRVEHLATTLDQRGLDGVAQDVRGFARRRPGLFLAAAGAAGFAVARAIRYQRQSDGNGSGAQPGLTGRGGVGIADVSEPRSGEPRAGRVVLDTPEPSPARTTAPPTTGGGFPA